MTTKYNFIVIDCMFKTSLVRDNLDSLIANIKERLGEAEDFCLITVSSEGIGCLPEAKLSKLDSIIRPLNARCICGSQSKMDYSNPDEPKKVESECVCSEITSEMKEEVHSKITEVTRNKEGFVKEIGETWWFTADWPEGVVLVYDKGD